MAYKVKCNEKMRKKLKMRETDCSYNKYERGDEKIQIYKTNGKWR